MIIYDGPSMIDGVPIICIATGFKTNSNNIKTGSMIQTWILVRDVDPRDANKLGLDYSICGDCPLKGTPRKASEPEKLAKDRPCYVSIYQAPLNVWRKYHRGGYDYVVDHDDLVDLGDDRLIRLGSYGDPAAIPSHIWDSFLTKSVGRTGYTHQHSIPSADTRYDLCMHSADSVSDARKAWANGLRTFRVIDSLSSMIKDKEILCPASKEAGYRTTCDSCKLCSGSQIKAKSIAIVAHGNGAKYAYA